MVFSKRATSNVEWRSFSGDPKGRGNMAYGRAHQNWLNRPYPGSADLSTSSVASPDTIISTPPITSA